MLLILKIYGKCVRDNITKFVDAGKKVFVGVTYDWCVMCKFNRVVALDSISMIGIFHRKTQLKCDVTLLPNMVKYINSLLIMIYFQFRYILWFVLSYPVLVLL